MQVKAIAPRYPAVTLILDVTSGGKDVTADEVRQKLHLSKGQLNGQLGAFSRRILSQIAPEWATKFPTPGWAPPGATAEATPGWHWPFGSKVPADGSSLIYNMPEQVRRIWLSLDAA
jgi:hypothetical protein